MRKLLLTSGLALFAVVATSYAFAADPTDNRDPAANQPTAGQARDAGGGQNMFLDHLLASGLRQMSQGEVDLANFALKRSQNEEVRRFANMMVQDHENLDKQLQQYANLGGQRGGTNEQSTASGNIAANPANPQPANPNEANQANANQAHPHGALADLQKECGANIVASIEKQLGQFQGADFDRAYLGQQFWGHVIFIAQAETAQKHVSNNELKQVIQQGQQTAEKHLQEAQRLIGTLSSNVARNPGGATETTPRR